MADGPKKPVPRPESWIWRPKILTPEEVQRQMIERMARLVRARAAKIEQDRKEAEAFERGLESALTNIKATTAEPAPLAQSEPTTNPQPAIDPFRSGGPGRPTAKHIVVEEGKRRINAGEEAPTPKGLTQFAAKLAQWWEQKRMTLHPPGPPLKAKTISNSLRDFWNSKL